MPFEQDLLSARSLNDHDGEVVAFLRDRSVPCPRCAYDLRDAPSAKCPECGEPLVLKVGSPKSRFGWLVLAMAPGCFSGVAAMFVAVPIVLSTLPYFGGGQGPPWPIVAADLFGFTSAATVVLIYRQRHRIMFRTAGWQATFAVIVWGVHVLAFVLFLLGMWSL